MKTLIFLNAAWFIVNPRHESVSFFVSVLFSVSVPELNECPDPFGKKFCCTFCVYQMYSRINVSYTVYLTVVNAGHVIITQFTRASSETHDSSGFCSHTQYPYRVNTNKEMLDRISDRVTNSEDWNQIWKVNVFSELETFTSLFLNFIISNALLLLFVSNVNNFA